MLHVTFCTWKSITIVIAIFKKYVQRYALASFVTLEECYTGYWKQDIENVTKDLKRILITDWPSQLATYMCN